MINGFSPKTGFIFYSLAPFILATMVLMPLLLQRHDAMGILVTCAIEIVAALSLLGMYDYEKFNWAWRGVGAAVFTGYAIYLIAMLVDGGQQKAMGRRSQPSAINAFCGLILLGLPGLYFAVTGSLPHPRNLAFGGQTDGDANASDDDAFMAGIKQMPVSVAKKLAEELLADPSRFTATKASSPLPAELAGRVSDCTRQFLDAWEEVSVEPLHEANLGRRWFGQYKGGGLILIGNCEDNGCLLAGRDSDEVFDEQGVNDDPEHRTPYAPTVYHAILILDNIYNGSGG